MAFEAGISLNKIAFDIADQLGNVEDFGLRERIKFKALQYRATILRRDLERNFLSKQFLQWLCLPLKCVPLSDCCDIQSEENVLRTVDKLPIPLRTKDIQSFYFVGEINKLTAFPETDFSTINLLKYRRFTASKPVFVYDGEYIYLFNPPTDEFSNIAIGSVFEYPEQAALLGCDGNKCYTDDDPFPIGADQYVVIEAMLLESFRNQRPTESEEVNINE